MDKSTSGKAKKHGKDHDTPAGNNDAGSILPHHESSVSLPTNRSNGMRLVVIGFVSLAVLFILYARYQDPANLTPDAMHVIQRLAYGFYVVVVAIFCAISYGMYRYHIAKVASSNAGMRDLNSIIAITTWNSRARKIFVIVFVTYGVFFSLSSGMLVYQPEISFETHYGAEIPSGFVSPCCDDVGYMPKIIIYLTDNVGLQIIPINLVLQIVVSYLVGLNASLAAGAYAISKKRRGLGTIGAATGLFIACPTCAGTFFSVFVGTASGIVLSAALTQMQTLFIAISIPILLFTPFLMARRIRDAIQNDKCNVVVDDDDADDDADDDTRMS